MLTHKRNDFVLQPQQSQPSDSATITTTILADAKHSSILLNQQMQQIIAKICAFTQQNHHNLNSSTHPITTDNSIFCKPSISRFDTTTSTFNQTTNSTNASFIKTINNSANRIPKQNNSYLSLSKRRSTSSTYKQQSSSSSSSRVINTTATTSNRASSGDAFPGRNTTTSSISYATNGQKKQKDIQDHRSSINQRLGITLNTTSSNDNKLKQPKWNRNSMNEDDDQNEAQQQQQYNTSVNNNNYSHSFSVAEIDTTYDRIYSSQDQSHHHHACASINNTSSVNTNVVDRLYDNSRSKRVERLHSQHVQNRMDQELSLCTFKPELINKHKRSSSINGASFKTSVDTNNHNNSIKGFENAVERIRSGFDRSQKLSQQVNQSSLGIHFERNKNRKFNPPSMLARNDGVFYIANISLHNGRKRKISMKEDDDPKELAQEFARKYGLTESERNQLQSTLEESFKAHLFDLIKEAGLVN